MRRSFLSLIAFLAAAFLIGVSHVPASATAAGPASQSAVQAVCHTCNGIRYQNPGDRAVYLVIDGLRHLVPDEATYFNLWATWDGIQTNGANITIGDSLVRGAFLAQEIETGKVYLVGRTKRWIPNMTVFNQYMFDAARIRRLSAASLPDEGPVIPGR